MQLDGHRKKNKIKLAVSNIEANRGQICSQRHEVTGTCKTLGYISSFKLFFFLLLLEGVLPPTFFFVLIIGAQLAISGYYKALRATKSHKNSKFRNYNAALSSLLYRSSNILEISILPD